LLLCGCETSVAAQSASAKRLRPKYACAVGGRGACGGLRLPGLVALKADVASLRPPATDSDVRDESMHGALRIEIFADHLVTFLVDACRARAVVWS
jgi:hypothetical protein